MTDRNPKALAASSRVPAALMPATALAEMSLAFYEGVCRGYGPFSWREVGVAVSTYVNAMSRHMQKYANGQDRDPKTRVHELASVMACCAILIDCERCGNLEDDRPPSVDMAKMFAELEGVVKHLQTVFPAHAQQAKAVAERGLRAVAETPFTPFPMIPVGHGHGNVATVADYAAGKPVDHYAQAGQQWDKNAAEKRAEGSVARQQPQDATEPVIEQRRVEAMNRRLIDTDLAADSKPYLEEYSAAMFLPVER